MVPSPEIIKSSLFQNFEIRRTLDAEDKEVQHPTNQQTSYTKDYPSYENRPVTESIRPVHVSDVDGRLPFFLVRKVKNYGENAIPENLPRRKRGKSGTRMKNLVFGSFCGYSTEYNERFKGEVDLRPSEIYKPQNGIPDVHKELAGSFQYKTESQDYKQRLLEICPAKGLRNRMS